MLARTSFPNLCGTSVKKWSVIGNRCVVLICGFIEIATENDRVARVFRTKLDLLCKREAIKPRLIEKTLVRFGKPFQEICDAARGLKVDLIVISTHGYTGLKHAVLGSTAERVVRHAPCPVFVVREQEHEFV